MNQPMRLFTFLLLFGFLPVFLLAQRPVSVRTDQGRGVKQEQQEPAANRPTASQANRSTETTRPPQPTTGTNRSGSDSNSGEMCPPGWGQTGNQPQTRQQQGNRQPRTAPTRTRRTTQTTSRPSYPRTRTTSGSDRPGQRTTTNRRTTQRGAECPPPAPRRDCDCDDDRSNARRGKAGNRGRGWAHGHNKKANPNARALRIPSVPAHGKKARATGGFAGGVN